MNQVMKPIVFSIAIALAISSQALVAEDSSTQSQTGNKETVTLEEVNVTDKAQEEIRSYADQILNEDTATGSWLGLPPREQVNVIQVVPRDLIEDRGQPAVLNILDKIPGIRPVAPAYTDSGAGIRSRGFENFESFVNGNRLSSFAHPTESANIERIEVFKGPAAIQYGITDPGGTVNITTKRPVRERLLNFKGTAGSFDFYRGEVDAGGAVPGTNSKLLSRFNLAYQNTESHRDFDQGNRWFAAPALRWEIGPRTSWDVEFNYQHNEFRFNRGLNPQAFILGLPFNRSFMEPNLPLSSNNSYSVFSTLEHRFGNGDWGVRQRFGYFNIDIRPMRLTIMSTTSTPPACSPATTISAPARIPTGPWLIRFLVTGPPAQ